MITLNNGKRVEYEYDLVQGGADIYIITGLTSQEREEFKKEIQYEHDVRKLIFHPFNH